MDHSIDLSTFKNAGKIWHKKETMITVAMLAINHCEKFDFSLFFIVVGVSEDWGEEEGEGIKVQRYSLRTEKPNIPPNPNIAQDNKETMEPINLKTALLPLCFCHWSH